MGQHHTPEQVQQRYNDSMGRDAGGVSYGLFNECCQLHLKWSEYVTLFGHNEDRIKLLNLTAPGFFRIVEDSLWEDILLHICRMTDGDRNVLSLGRLARLVKPAIRDEVESRLASVVATTAFAKDWRDRHIAHRNLQLALNQDVEPLAHGSRLTVTAAVRAIADFLGFVEGSYERTSPTVYDFLNAMGGADDLISVLERGIHPLARSWYPSSITHDSEL